MFQGRLLITASISQEKMYENIKSSYHLYSYPYFLLKILTKNCTNNENNTTTDRQMDKWIIKNLYFIRIFEPLNTSKAGWVSPAQSEERMYPK